MRKNKLFFLALIPLLVSCQQIPEYEGEKIQLQYAEEGGLFQITADTLYTNVITKGEDRVVLFTIDGCASCEEAKSQIQSFGVGFHCKIDEINMNSINIAAGDYDKIVATTNYLDDVYEFPEITEETTYPKMYMFKQRGVAMVKQSNFIDALRMYTEVVNVPTNE